MSTAIVATLPTGPLVEVVERESGGNVLNLFGGHNIRYRNYKKEPSNASSYAHSARRRQDLDWNAQVRRRRLRPDLQRLGRARHPQAEGAWHRRCDKACKRAYPPQSFRRSSRSKIFDGVLMLLESERDGLIAKLAALDAERERMQAEIDKLERAYKTLQGVS